MVSTGNYGSGSDGLWFIANSVVDTGTPFNYSNSTAATMSVASTAGWTWHTLEPKEKVKVVEKVVEKIIEVAPEIDPFCEWCGALWFPGEYRKGCCSMCGGGRSSQIPPHVFEIDKIVKQAVEEEKSGKFKTIKMRVPADMEVDIMSVQDKRRMISSDY
jgi:hypothetical protein